MNFIKYTLRYLCIETLFLKMPASMLLMMVYFLLFPIKKGTKFPYLESNIFRKGRKYGQ